MADIGRDGEQGNAGPLRTGNGVRADERRRGSRLWYLLLIPPFVGLLWLPLYATASPKLFGFPFFYWYQFAWVPLTAALTWIVFRKSS